MNSPYYTSYIQRERHAIVDRAVEASIETLRVPEIAHRLGKYVTSLMDILEHTTVPNVRDNKIRLDAACDSRVPIVPVHPDEVLYRNPCDVGFNAAQRLSLYGGFGDKTANLIIEQQQVFASQVDCPVRIESLNESNVLAYVTRCAWPLETTRGTMMLQSSPIVLIDANRPRRRDSTVLLHELTHVYQMHEYPIEMPEDDQYRLLVENELEAYHVEAEIIRGYQDAGQYDALISRALSEGSLEFVLLTDEVRKAHQSSAKKPFEVTDKMLRALEENDIKLTSTVS